MQYIFFNPKTLKIMGASTDKGSLEFPYVESEIQYHSFDNLAIEKVNEKYQLKIIKGYL